MYCTCSSKNLKVHNLQKDDGKTWELVKGGNGSWFEQFWCLAEDLRLIAHNVLYTIAHNTVDYSVLGSFGSLHIKNKLNNLVTHKLNNKIVVHEKYIRQFSSSVGVYDLIAARGTVQKRTGALYSTVDSLVAQ